MAVYHAVASHATFQVASQAIVCYTPRMSPDESPVDITQCVMELRASSLDMFNDCARLAAARVLGPELKEAGYAMRQLDSPIGRAMGTAVHAGIAVALTAKMEGRDPFAREVATPVSDAAFAALKHETCNGVVWDKTTPSNDVAEYQVKRLIKAAVPLIEKADPVLVERGLQAEYKSEHGTALLKGHPDFIDRRGPIVDVKTGVQERMHWAQGGIYSLLAASQQPPIVPRVTEFIIAYFKRTPRNSVQKPMNITRYDAARCERAAMETVDRALRDIAAFRKSGDPGCFAPNAMSMMCRAKYCAAHGTDWCQYGRK